jgi:predicted dehydrogenase
MNHSSSSPLGRRSWLKSASALTASLCLSSSALPLRAQPNSRLEIGLIGVGVRGKYLLANLPETVRVTALCDCSRAKLDTALNPKREFARPLAAFAAGPGRACQLFQDYRRMLAEMQLDAVIIAAPDHHHASAAIAAMKAGCHVYVEKPLSVTIAEGRAMVAAAAKYQRVVQVGSQQRSMRVNQLACEFIRNGGLGHVKLVEERNLPGPLPYEPQAYPAAPIPADLEWDLFCGPTPWRPYHPDLWLKEEYKVGSLLWRGWDLFQDYSGHLMTNWGAHSLDMVQAALGMDSSGPRRIEPLLEFDPAWDEEWAAKTPPLGSSRDRLADQARFRPVRLFYDQGTEVRLVPGIKHTVFHGEKGILKMGRNFYECQPGNLLPPMKAEDQRLWEGAGHVARPHLENWIDAIHGRAPLLAPLEVGHRSATVCHLANLARQVAAVLHWNPEQERFLEPSSAEELVSRPRRPGFELAS